MEPVLRPGEAYPYPVPHGWKLLAGLRLKDPKLTLREAAQTLGYNHQTLSIWIKKPAYQAYEQWLTDRAMPSLDPAQELVRGDILAKVRTNYETHAEEMQDRLLALVESTDDVRLQKEIAFEWLERAGAGAPQKAVRQGVTFVFTDEVAQKFLSRIQEAGLALPDVTEGELIGS